MTLTRELSVLTRMALPVTAAQLGSMAMGIVDIIMIGQFTDLVDPQALSAVALGDIWVFGTLIVGIGTLMGLDPIVSQAHGAGDGPRAGRALQHGVVLAVLLSIPLAATWYFAEEALVLLGQDPVLAHKAADYCDIQVFSVAPMLVFGAIRQYLQGRGKMAVALWIILLANVFNAVFDWVLILGHFGFPALGIAGAGLATGLTRCVMMLALVAWTVGFRLHVEAWVPWGRESFRISGLRGLLALGLPVGIQFALEVWAFQIASLLSGRLGLLQDDTDGTLLASHTIAMKLAALSFMVPFGISIASATRVGNLIGRGDRHGAQRAAWVAMAMGAAVMLVAATAFILGRFQLPRIFTEKPDIVLLTATVLPVAAAFQLFDGLQAVGAGVLRGMGNTRPAAVFNLVGFYLLAIPTAWWLAFETDLGLRGIWWGLCLGLAVVAVLLVAWIAVRGPARVVRSSPGSSVDEVTPDPGKDDRGPALEQEGSP